MERVGGARAEGKGRASVSLRRVWWVCGKQEEIERVWAGWR